MLDEDPLVNLSQQAIIKLETLKQQKIAFAPKDLQESRIAICKNCPALSVDKCAVCNCILSAKIRVLHTKCPIKKW
jgi:hypothetical protein